MHVCLNYNFQVAISRIIFERLCWALSHTRPLVCDGDKLDPEKSFGQKSEEWSQDFNPGCGPQNVVLCLLCYATSLQSFVVF